MISAPALLSQLDEEERYRRFDRLQELMTGAWAAMRAGHEDETVVVVPSADRTSWCRSGLRPAGGAPVALLRV
jgi:hypothetical protein